MSGEVQPWSVRTQLAEIQRAPRTLNLDADGAARTHIAETLGLADVAHLAAEVRLSPWRDGAEVRGRWEATVSQTCGVSLEAFDTRLCGEFSVRCVPRGSPALPEPEVELTVDPDAEDPPDLIEGGEIDPAAYVVEHLALELDPFPRKPGVAFEPPAFAKPASAFAVLAGLRRTDEPGEGL